MPKGFTMWKGKRTTMHAYLMIFLMQTLPLLAGTRTMQTVVGSLWRGSLHIWDKCLPPFEKMVKCGDYFQAEDGPKEFGNIHIVTKWIKTTDTSIVLRHLEVKYKECRGTK